MNDLNNAETRDPGTSWEDDFTIQRRRWSVAGHVGGSDRVRARGIWNIGCGHLWDADNAKIQADPSLPGGENARSDTVGTRLRTWTWLEKRRACECQVNLATRLTPIFNHQMQFVDKTIDFLQVLAAPLLWFDVESSAQNDHIAKVAYFAGRNLGTIILS
jgi:hypothetical protein